MSEGVIEFGEVSNIYRLEREKRGELAKIPDDFFQRLREHITELRRQAGVEEAQNSGSKKAMMLLEDVKKLSSMSDAIHDSRERKIVILAQQRGDLSKASLTSHERELVKHLRERLDVHRDRLEGKHSHAGECAHAEQPRYKAGVYDSRLEPVQDVPFRLANRDVRHQRSASYPDPERRPRTVPGGHARPDHRTGPAGRFPRPDRLRQRALR